MRRRLLLVALSLVALSGCGGSSPAVTVPKPTQVSPAPGRSCTAQNYAMQCALFGQPHPGPTLGQSVPSIYGVDFAWGGPRSCSAMRSIGARFGWSYFSYDSSGKNWTAGLVSAFHSCGIATVGGWETTATRALDGKAAGISDAREAARQAAAVGNTTRPLTFAIDFDASGQDVYSYFAGCHATIGDRCNAYGSYRAILYLYQRHVVGRWNFQTYAWSGGAWLPGSIAPLEQYLNGNSFDNDRAIEPDYGQWPAPAPPGPSDAQIRSWRNARESAFASYHKRGCTVPQQSSVCRSLGHQVIDNQNRLWSVPRSGYRRWACFGSRASKANLQSEVCWIVRPEVSWWSHARDSSRHAFDTHVCGGANGQVGLTPQCEVWRQRDVWFGQRASSTVKAYS